MIKVIEKGTIKIVWIDKLDFIYSKMFDRVEDAEAFGRGKKDYLIFELIKEHNMEEFTWRILPYGRYPLYKKLFNFYQKGFISNWLKLKK